MTVHRIALVAANAVAALLWLLSAIVPRFPTKFTSPYSAPPPELIPMAKALKLQSRLSAGAALCAAAAAALSAF